jgi:hypothetical protein
MLQTTNLGYEFMGDPNIGKFGINVPRKIAHMNKTYPLVN